MMIYQKRIRKDMRDDFSEDGYIPDFIPSAELNQFVFNENTVDMVLQDLMERGIKVQGGDLIGKTIILLKIKTCRIYPETVQSIISSV